MTIQSSVYRWYRQGTVAVTNGSTAVTGTTTAWSTNVKAGDGFSLDGATWYEVASVTDNTHLVLASNFGGSTTSGASYAIDRRSLAWQVGSEAAARVLALQQMLQQTLKTTGQPPDTIGSDGAVAYDATAMVFYTNTGGTWDTGTSFRGSTVLNGAGAPSSGTGNNADFYLDTTNTRLYGPKTGGAWGSYVSLVGPTGSTGPTGATGATGPANSLSIGTVTTGAAGSSASATITGTAPTQTLSLTIPRGDTGATGAGTGDALTTNPLSQFAATTSAQLRGVISDETGTGALVFATSPTLVTPTLGTPASGTLTNCTGLPASGVTGLYNGQNLLINGDCKINQRAFAGGSLSSGVYGFDHWKAGNSGVAMSVSGDVITIDHKVSQIVELALWRISSLANVALTLSAEDVSSSISVSVGDATGVLPSGSGRTSVTLTPTTSGDITVSLDTGSGAVTLKRVQLEIGATATVWRARPMTEEMLLCQRYYFTTYDQGTAPGTATYSGAVFNSFDGTTSYGFVGGVSFPALMRASPTIVLYSPVSGATGKAVVDGVDKTAASAGVGTRSASVYLNNQSVGAAQFGYVHLTATAEL